MITRPVINEKNSNAYRSSGIQKSAKKATINPLAVQSIIWERGKCPTISITVMNNDHVMEQEEMGRITVVLRAERRPSMAEAIMMMIQSQ
jgi:hypothetical protein